MPTLTSLSMILSISLPIAKMPLSFNPGVLALEQIRTMRDITLYTALLQVYDQTVMTFGVENGLVPRQELAQTDQRWIEETGRRNQEERAKLEVELKNYQSNLIRESIRVSGLKLGSFGGEWGVLKEGIYRWRIGTSRSSIARRATTRRR